MIRVQQIKVPLNHTAQDIIIKLAKQLHLKESQITKYKIVKQSIDARKKDMIHVVYTIDFETAAEDSIIQKYKNMQIKKIEDETYHFPMSGTQKLQYPPVIVGFGPAGMFCAYELALRGYAPIILERGKNVEERNNDIQRFWNENILDTSSNVQFGEGGAGTFSDGKLNTLVKDLNGRNRRVLELFVEMGAPEEILYEAKPHIGTDILISVVRNLRQEILRLGGKIYFNSCMTDLEVSEGKLTKIQVNHKEWILASTLVLALGHSARDTFFLLEKKQVSLEAKSFAVGFRVEHPQSMIQINQYGTNDRTYLKTAPYKVTAQSKNRGVYSFCMCPGGYVVNASSEEEMLAVNGMSYYKRDSDNANSAIIVSVTPDDFPDKGVLSGIYFQRELEKKAYELGNGLIPQQLYGDYKTNLRTKEYGEFTSCTKGKATFADLNELFTPDMKQSFIDGMEQFDHKIKGFARYDAILSGIESRTSSPIRILRDSVSFESNIKGIYPCGEGAGYAGGIMSAAMDGQKIAEAIGAKFQPFAANIE